MKNEKMDDMKMDMDHSKMDMSGNNGHMMMHGGHMMDMGDLRQKFWISLVLAIPVFILSPFMGLHLPFQFQFPGSDWLVLILATILYFYGGKPFITGARGELAEKKPAMMTLITMGISVAYIYSLYAFVENNLLKSSTHVMDFFWELASLIVIMLLGHWIEMKSTMSAGNALQKIASLVPNQVHMVHDDMTMDHDISMVKAGDIVEIRAGESVPLDGYIISGESYINESLITGESKAVKKELGSKVVGGSINGEGTIRIKVDKAAGEGYLSQISKLVSDAQSSRSKSQLLADRVSGWLFYAALTVGIIAFVYWLIFGDMNTALNRLVTVLVIACPHALGLAIPLVMSRSTSIAATNGLIIRNNQAMENSRKIDYVAMDKTGTLTEGKFTVNGLQSIDESIDDQKLLAIIAGIESGSSHPIASSVVQYAKDQKATPIVLDNIQAIKGYGMSGTLNNQDYYLINMKYLNEHKITLDKKYIQTYLDKGNTISYLVSNQKVLGFVALGDRIKKNTIEFIKELKSRNITPIMLTGDNKEAAAIMAKQMGIDEFRAELLPEDKHQVIKQLEVQGHHVLMVGDGINDAPSLASATIGVAIGAGTDVAIDSADVVLYNSDPSDIIKFLKLSHNTYRKTVENLWWGAGYNIIAIPLAAGILAGVGFVLSPAVGAIVMSLSTVVVAINALTLKM
ncbi:putative copper-transporting P-type ATPase B [Companilactobacillus crustorum]|uniref:P-type Cu(+) transporter n=3 Tax=Companilactobacillus TaxID=2767879 RepID=A0A837RIS8_9LACO|nr:heavy metal translocating P-type ATPase [Companilactobacillus crustorum]APU71902.1 putative copper-transporting P-type ATPase B [Companilactobacillus crustorum]KRK42692.1 cation transport ATPase [Companilactobacillus crustorum JCM 15951]KRO21298.1 cation transport ATPase [Companilactobacillus crustorum]WDT66013.1 copper-translocating P-type ATPase [Companilactobacillus crustorum]GEO76457.1 putative copper-transporting P-type ATPase B [Companilactobacillus crustorum]